MGSEAVSAALGRRPGPVKEQSTCLLATTSPWISFSFGVFLLPLSLLVLSIAFHKCRLSGLPGQFRQSNVPLAPATPLPKPCQCPFSQQQWEVNGFPGGPPDLWKVALRFLLSLESSASSLAAYFLSLWGSSRTNRIPSLFATPSETSPTHLQPQTSFSSLARQANFFNQAP